MITKTPKTKNKIQEEKNNDKKSKQTKQSQDKNINSSTTLENGKLNLLHPSLYFNRELSWLEFNSRVLEEAQDKNNKLLERLKFLAITASNLDEFFMVRVSNIMEKAISNIKSYDDSGLTCDEQLSQISIAVHDLVHKQYNCLNRSILPTLEKNNIKFIDFLNLTKSQKDFVNNYFDHTIYPVLTPMAIDQSRPFPLLSNKSLNLIIELEDDSNQMYCVVQVPSVLNRFFKLPNENGETQFILLEEIIKQNLHKLFNGHKVLHSFSFRITRDSDLTIDEEETEDLLHEIEKSIKRRKWGEPVRLEIEKNMQKDMQKFLEQSLFLDQLYIYEITGPLDLTFYMKFASQDGFLELKNEILTPVRSIHFLDRNMFDVIKEKDILIHHPYESFDDIVNFVKLASVDPKVLAIKQTLYRVSGNSPIVNALIQAAENGKQVTVLVELKARFDEENNINWAKKLEKSGCHVIYGLVGLKTHCKICLVVRDDDDEIRRYVHLGTGNYNDSTAKIYTDIAYFTSKESFGKDISSLFNVLTGYSVELNFNKISVAPTLLRNSFLKLINNEIKNAELGKDAFIIAKMNSLVDQEIISTLYKASISGVKIELIVRGICCLRSGVKDISENISVVSIVDRFLEHSRIFYFCNDGNSKILLSSADWMPRNLNKRVEIALPIEDATLKEELINILKITLSDTEKLRIQQPDGSYSRVDRRGKEIVHSQLAFYNLYKSQFKETTKIKPEEIYRPNESHKQTL